MAWEAPNLLDRIFKTPDTGSGSTLGAFLGGYIAGADKKKAAAPVAKQAGIADDGAQSGADYGTPANPAAPATTDPAATTVSAPPSNWFKDFAKSTLEGEQIGQNITAFEAAKTTDKVRQAQLVGEVLKNRGLQNALDYQTQDQGVLHQVMQETDPVKIGDAVMPELRTTQGRAAFLQWKASAAQTAAEEADKTVRTQDLAQFGVLKRAGYDIDLQKLPNGELQPDKEQLKQASADYDQVLQQRALAKAKIAADAKIEAAGLYTGSRERIQALKNEGILDAIDEKALNTPSGADAEPQVKDLGGGLKATWMPGAKTMHVIKPDGTKKDLTPTQTLNLGKALLAIGDTEGTNFVKLAKEMATPGKKPAAVTPAAKGAKVVNSQAEYDALPVGTTYTDSYGKTKTKK